MNLHNAQFVRSVTSVADCPHDGIPQIVFAGKSNVGGPRQDHAHQLFPDRRENVSDRPARIRLREGLKERA